VQGDPEFLREAHWPREYRDSTLIFCLGAFEFLVTPLVKR
jgi:hypothetical protein